MPGSCARWAGTAVLIALYAICAAAQVAPPPGAPPEAKPGRAGAPQGPPPTYANLDYAPPDPPSSNGHKLDLYIPAGASRPLPVVIWTGGSARPWAWPARSWPRAAIGRRSRSGLATCWTRSDQQSPPSRPASRCSTSPLRLFMPTSPRWAPRSTRSISAGCRHLAIAMPLALSSNATALPSTRPTQAPKWRSTSQSARTDRGRCHKGTPAWCCMFGVQPPGRPPSCQAAERLRTEKKLCLIRPHGSSP